MPSPNTPLIKEISWAPPEHFFSLCNEHTHSVFLDSSGDTQHDRQRWSFLCPHPSGTLTIYGRSTAAYWDTLRNFLHKHTPHKESFPTIDIPFIGGVIGTISYEAGLACEKIISRHDTKTPSITAMACRNLFAFDRLTQRAWWISPDRIEPPKPPHRITAAKHTPLRFIPDHDSMTWLEAVKKLRHYIQQGDIFQANLTMRWRCSRPENLDLYELYIRLRRNCPAPFGAWYHTPEFSLLSASVERFIHLSTNKKIETRPIKGTTHIDPDPKRNKALQKALAINEKEYAENLMITDLMRHDIGKVCQLGSVNVPQLCNVEPFAHMNHLVSSVQGILKPDLDAIDLLAATLPPGSVTGAPKHRALEIIDELEVSSRGAYCGTLFRLGWDDTLDSSVIIRSLSATPDELTLGAGSGITWSSDAMEEYKEMHLKAAALLHVVQTL